MTYARARLWLGISGVGFFVVASASALYFDVARRAFPGKSSVTAILITLALYVALSIPGDLLGGYVLPTRYQRTTISFGAYLRSWLQGVVCQSLTMAVCALLILLVASRFGTLAGLSTFALLMLCLLLGQLVLAGLVGGLTQIDARQEGVTYQSTDPAFVGGFVGFPGAEKLVFPAAWVNGLPADIVAMQRARRLGALRTGARTRGLVLALVWNLAGFALASQLPRAGLSTPVGLINTALWFTLWSFVGLLLLPTFNRPGVLEADRFALSQGFAFETMARGISALDRLQDDEPDRSRWVERVFHPIPSVESRLQALRAGTSARGAWQGARVTLYLSWAGLGFLSRAVHCNVGRPELWVLFPGD